MEASEGGREEKDRDVGERAEEQRCNECDGVEEDHGCEAGSSRYSQVRVVLSGESTAARGSSYSVRAREQTNKQTRRVPCLTCSQDFVNKRSSALDAECAVVRHIGHSPYSDPTAAQLEN